MMTWTLVRGQSADGSAEWEEKWWTTSDTLEFKVWPVACRKCTPHLSQFCMLPLRISLFLKVFQNKYHTTPSHLR